MASTLPEVWVSWNEDEIYVSVASCPKRRTAAAVLADANGVSLDEYLRDWGMPLPTTLPMCSVGGSEYDSAPDTCPFCVPTLVWRSGLARETR